MEQKQYLKDNVREFLNLMKDTTLYIQETQWPTRRINIKKITSGTALWNYWNPRHKDKLDSTQRLKACYLQWATMELIAIFSKIWY